MPAHQYIEFNELLSQDIFSLLKENPEADLSEIKIIPDIQEENPLLGGGTTTNGVADQVEGQEVEAEAE